uniref:Uncharacterized protein n=1 Tax=Lepeophtheirus salmonis TaxID=72036 RepID=A0A0K2ULG3_LEPSM
MLGGISFPSLVSSAKTMALAGFLVFITEGTEDLEPDSHRSFCGL